MDTNLKTIFAKTKYLPEAGFSEKIWEGLLAYEAKRATKKLYFSSLISVASLVGSVFAFIYLAGEVTRSGFFQYLSTAFSDLGTTAMYWKEFSLTIIDSIPLIGVLLVLASIFVFFASLKFTSRYFIKNKYSLLSV